MEKLLYDLMMVIIGAVVGGFSGAVIPRLMFPERQEKSSKELNFTQIHIEQRKIIQTTYVDKKTVRNNNSNTQGLDGTTIIIFCIVGWLFLVYGFLRFESQIKMILIMSTVILESFFGVAAYMIIRKNMIDTKMKAILITNIISTLYIPVMIYLIGNPIINRTLDRQQVLQLMQEDGFVSILFEQGVLGFLIFQVVGVLFIFAYILLTILSTLHLLSMLNLALEGRGKALFTWIFRKTYFVCKTFGCYLVMCIILIVFSTIFILGLPGLLMQ